MQVGAQALRFLIQCLFDLYILILALRLILSWAGINYWHPVTQFIVKLTNGIVKPLRKLIPNVAGIEIASVVLILVLEMVKFTLLAALTFGLPNMMGVFLVSLGDGLNLIIQIFFYALIFQAILSWIQPASPLNYLLVQMTQPILKPLQRLIPPIGGIDISIIPALLILQLLVIILVGPLKQAGMTAMITG